MLFSRCSFKCYGFVTKVILKQGCDVTHEKLYKDIFLHPYSIVLMNDLIFTDSLTRRQDHEERIQVSRLPLADRQGLEQIQFLCGATFLPRKLELTIIKGNIALLK